MEKLLALHHISIVTFPVDNGEDRQFAFTSKMAANNIFIEFRIELDMDEEYEEDEEGEEAEFGARLSVLIKHKRSYYEFLMFYDTVDLKIPILLAQTIIFLANLCDSCAPDHLLDILLETCPDPLIPDEITDAAFREAALHLISIKIDSALQLIQERKSGQN